MMHTVALVATSHRIPLLDTAQLVVGTVSLIGIVVHRHVARLVQSLVGHQVHSPVDH